MKNCDICGTSMREGKYGESKYICENTACEKSQPNWVQLEWSRKIEPITLELEEYEKFSQGVIVLDDQADLDHGSAILYFHNGSSMECRMHHGKLEPFEIPEKRTEIALEDSVIAEIKHHIRKIFELREKLTDVIRTGSM